MNPSPKDAAIAPTEDEQQAYVTPELIDLDAAKTQTPYFTTDDETALGPS